jgi:glutamate synthase domain-containing protein 2
MVTKFALGADVCNSARGMMMALGCIQALRCNSNQCPTGIATQDPELYKLLDVEDKSKRVASYHRRTMTHVMELINSIGVSEIKNINKTHVKHRLDVGRIATYDDLYESVPRGAFLTPATIPEKFKSLLAQADTAKF